MKKSAERGITETVSYMVRSFEISAYYGRMRTGCLNARGHGELFGRLLFISNMVLHRVINAHLAYDVCVRPRPMLYIPSLECLGGLVTRAGGMIGLSGM